MFVKRVLVLFFVVGSSAWASTSEMTIDPTLSNALIIEEDMLESNAQLRLGKRYSLTGEPLGLGPTRMFGQGLNMGFYLDPDTMLSMEFHSAGSSLLPLKELPVDLNSKASSFGVHYKKFIYDSFYMKGGVDQRRIEVKVNYLKGVDQDSRSREFVADSTVISFAVGNQWQWEDLTIGCDWVGLTQPVTSSIVRESYSGQVSDKEKEDQDDDFFQYVTGLGYMAVRFYIGASF